MINLANVSSDFILSLTQNPYFEEVLVCTSFPKSVKPTLLSHPAIAVGVSSVRFDEASVGQSVLAGRVCIFASLYIPYLIKNQISMDEILAEICKSASGMGIVSLSCEKPYSDKYTECIVQNVEITFNDEIFFEEQ